MDNYDKDTFENSLKLLAHRILPEIKKYFSDEKIQREYKEWLKEKQKSKS